MNKKKVLFLCTGNSARSQMAEGLVNHFLRESWEAFSAGTKPSGYIHPLAVQAMAELGIDISQHTSKSVNVWQGQAFDVIITVCDQAAQTCPLWLGPGRAVYMGFPDPAAATGSDAEKLEAFRRVRDGLRERVLVYLQDVNLSAGDATPSIGAVHL